VITASLLSIDRPYPGARTPALHHQRDFWFQSEKPRPFISRSAEDGDVLSHGVHIAKCALQRAGYIQGGSHPVR